MPYNLLLVQYFPYTGGLNGAITNVQQGFINAGGSNTGFSSSSLNATGMAPVVGSLSGYSADGSGYVGGQDPPPDGFGGDGTSNNCMSTSQINYNPNINTVGIGQTAQGNVQSVPCQGGGGGGGSDPLNGISDPTDPTDFSYTDNADSF